MIARLLLLLRDSFTDYPRSSTAAWRVIWASRNSAERCAPGLTELEEQRVQR
jgi:hypothetical protein